MEQKFEEKQLEHFRETMDRLTAASHVQIEYFEKHQKVEGYLEYSTGQNWFNCDRLMKQDNMFGTIQIAYQPTRERVLLFANLKTSRYDTISSRYQKEMQDYQMRRLRKGSNENQAYVSKPKEEPFILVEKKENKPWSQRSIKTYLKRESTKTLEKLLPFFMREEELEQLEKLRSRQKEIQAQIQSLQNQAYSEEMEKSQQLLEKEGEKRELRKEAVENLMQENLLEVLLQRKSTAAKSFLRRINYAYDYQKKDIENYYREKKKTLKETKTLETEDENKEDDN